MPTSSPSDDRIAAVGPDLEVPAGTVEVDASGGIVMPGMIDTHRHMWQTAMRGYGADWTLTQYFVWYYLEYGKHFRPEDIDAGNLLAAAEAIDAGVTTCVDWSHGLQTVDHADAAVDALQAIPGRFVLAYGNIQQPPVGVVGQHRSSATSSSRRITGDDMLGFQMAFDVPGDPSFPEQGAFEVARELGVPVTTHAGVWGATNDDGIRLMHEQRLHDAGVDLRARRDADRGLLPAHRRHRRVDLGVDRERAERRPGLPAHLGDPHARHPGVAVDGHQRVVERRPVHARCAPRWARTARASTWRRTPRARRSPTARCAPSHVVDWATRGGAKALGRDDGPRQHRGRQEGRPGAAQERRLAGVVPDPQPLRPRGVPGPARRRAHGAGRRPGGEARRRSWSASTCEAIRRQGRDDGRLPALDDGRGGLGSRG